MICISLDGPTNADFLGDHMPPNLKVFFVLFITMQEMKRSLARSLEIQKENWG